MTPCVSLITTHRRGVSRSLLFLWAILLAACSQLTQKNTPQITSGTAFVVDEQGYVLTANHVVRHKKYLYVKLASGKRWLPVEWISADERLDVALLKVPIHLKPLKLADWSSVPMGLEVVTIGYPLPGIQGMSQKISQGIINSQLGLKDNPNFFQFSAGVQQGSSGGPVLSLDQKVVGMVSQKIAVLDTKEKAKDTPQNINYALNAEALYRFLKGSLPEEGFQKNKLDLQERLPIFRLYDQSTSSIMAVIGSDQPL